MWTMRCALWGSVFLAQLAVAFSAPGEASGATIRQTAVNPVNLRTYHLVRGDALGEGIRPTEAEAFAKTLGGHLVTLNDAEEELWVRTTFNEFYLFIGLHDSRLEGQFEWFTGEPLNYTNWYPGEPNNFGGGEDWVHIYNFSNGNYQWNDSADVNSISGFPAYAVVEIVPEPGTASLLLAIALAGAMPACRRWLRSATALAMLCFIMGVGTSSAWATTIVFSQNSPVPAEAGGNGTQLYTGTRDGHLREHGGMGTNQGGETFLVIGQYANDEGDDTRILIDFENYGSLSSYLQTENLRVASATLRLFLRDATGTSPTTRQTLDVFASATRFNEGTGSSNARDGRPAENGESTWSHRVWPVLRWEAGGNHSSADWMPNALDVGTQVSGSSSTGYVDFDVTGAYNADGSNLNANHAGLVVLARTDDENPLQDNSLGGKQFLFDSSESANGTPPQLVFEFTPAPEPGTWGLLATGMSCLIIARRFR